VVRPTLKRGFSRKAVVLSGLVLALAVLSPASALAKAGGTDRPVKGTASGNVTATLGAPLGLTLDLTGRATHVGKYRVHLEGDGRFIGGEVVVDDGTWTLAAANGDHLTGTWTFTGPFRTDVHATTAVLTITGGTGRFADASGTITAQNLETPTCIAGPACPGQLLETAEGPAEGADQLLARPFEEGTDARGSLALPCRPEARGPGCRVDDRGSPVQTGCAAG
jgi:hypothetical protein